MARRRLLMACTTASSKEDVAWIDALVWCVQSMRGSMRLMLCASI
jgi:hypothetical protein